ncbi:MAG: hypothetical protein ACK4QW_09535 [Alphaproteobacteria bacterium]
MAEERRPGRSEMHRARRSRNLVLLVVLVALVVLFYFITIARMGS